MRGSTITLEDYPVEQAIDLFRAAGFDSLEMWKHHLKRCRTADLRRKFAAYAATRSISMGGFNAVGEDYFQPFGGDSQLKETLEGLQADTEFAASLGAPDVLVWEGRAPQGTTERHWIDNLLPRLVELFRSAIDFAKPLGRRFLVEPHPYTVGMNDDLLIRLCDKLDPGHFGITYDFCHYGVGRPTDYVEAVRKLGHRIRHIHFSDSDQTSSELHFPPGAGRMDLPALLAAFKEIGYGGTMTLDLYGYPAPVGVLRDAGARTLEAGDFLGIPA
jgi:sugar phosphate isomerase/epimerase